MIYENMSMVFSFSKGLHSWETVWLKWMKSQRYRDGRISACRLGDHQDNIPVAEMRTECTLKLGYVCWTFRDYRYYKQATMSRIMSTTDNML